MYFSQKRVSRIFKIGFEVKYVQSYKVSCILKLHFSHLLQTSITSRTTFDMYLKVSDVLVVTYHNNLLLQIGYEYVIKLI